MSFRVGFLTLEPPARPADRPPAGTAFVVVERGPHAGTRFGLDRDVLSVGRGLSSDIRLDDPTVSRRHAEFRRARRDGGEISVVDVGSRNGTYVNQERVDAAVLSDGDEVLIGNVRLLFLRP
ncbi:FHA domain-containing protein [Streptomyces echinoruber]|uniref:Phosphopeptide-binding protein n=1 Tax=Streptomyces echinoruber TaxID=68898 RepID=A0A918VBW5_9ACTN|nr:FHA domain-containing protein [Streptomyces echinoruber]GGZ86954.1 phosphopeptide-binding protein [Streptomyces echinoruber]